jgi:glucokinase
MYHSGDVRPENGGSAPQETGDRTALIGEIGKTSARFALTDAAGNFREASVRSYAADRHNTISGAMMAFKEESGLPVLPSRCSLAVAGVPRGDTISITNSRWFISRSGLAAMLKRPPLVINDFAANVWAVSATQQRDLQAIGSSTPTDGPGTFVVIGMGGGLGVAAFTRSEDGTVSVLATEAGHSEFFDDSPDVQPYAEAIRRQPRGGPTAEALLSSRGLAGLRNAVAAAQGKSGTIETGEEVLQAASHGDPHARKATELFSKALWRFAGNLTLTYGAWDGVFLTGKMVNALRSVLRQAEARQRFVLNGPYSAMLRNVPAAFLLLEHSELRGAAEAIRQQA